MRRSPSLTGSDSSEEVNLNSKLSALLPPLFHNPFLGSNPRPQMLAFQSSVSAARMASSTNLSQELRQPDAIEQRHEDWEAGEVRSESNVWYHYS